MSRGGARNTSPRIRLNRKAPHPSFLPFREIFKGFENVDAVRKVFGEDTGDVLNGLKVALIPFRFMYMGVRDQDGNLAVGTHHLKNSDLRTLYLDIIHELFHVGQFREDKERFGKEHQRYLKRGFDSSLYYRSPIEIPAYKHAVDEAERIGMSREAITEYLRIGPVDPHVFEEFLDAMKLAPRRRPRPRKRIAVRINRDVRTRLFKFTDYFIGFERVPKVRSLFGSRTTEVLRKLKVAFAPTPFGFISLNEDDGHLEVGSQYLEHGDERLIYMDIILCLSMLALGSRGNGREASHLSGFPSGAVEAYRNAVGEGRLEGLSDAEISGHLDVLRFRVPPKEFQGLMNELGL